MGALLEHQHYLRDHHRFAAYDLALAAVSPGRTVLDLGAGTGLLGLTALRHGAIRVYGVEATGLADWTRAVADSNASLGTYVVITGASRKIELPEQVDLVVSDQLGAFICEGEPLPALADAAQRHLKPSGQLVPSMIEFMVQAVQSPTVKQRLDFWTTRRFRLDVSPLRDVAVGTPIYEHSPVEMLAGPASSLGAMDPRTPRDSVDLRATVRVDLAGSVNGLAGFFKARLAPHVSITTAPGDPSRIDRENVVLILDPPIECSSGELLDVRIRGLLHSGILVWTVRTSSGETRRHSTWQALTAVAIPRG